jgi:hypothetical protein
MRVLLVAGLLLLLCGAGAPLGLHVSAWGGVGLVVLVLGLLLTGLV